MAEVQSWIYNELYGRLFKIKENKKIISNGQIQRSRIHTVRVDRKNRAK